MYVGAVCDRLQIPCCFASGFTSYHAMQLPPAISKRCALQGWGKSRGKTTRTLVTITYSTHIQHQRYLEAFGRLTYRLIAIGWRSTSASCIRRCSSDECSTESSSSRPPPYSNQTVSQSVKPLQVQSTLYVGAVCDRHQIPCCFASGFPSYHAMQLPPAISKRCSLQACVSG